MAEHLPLIFVHGFMGAGSDWAPITDHFTEHPLLPYDLPGHGGRPWTPGTTFESTAQSLMAANPPVILVGYSMGGRLALAAAAAFPERVGGLVLESASPGLHTDAERTERRSLDAERADRLSRLGMEPFLREWYGQPLFASLASCPELLEALILERSMHDEQALAEALRAFSVAEQPDYREALAGFEFPVLCIAGERDARYTELAREMAGLCPWGETRIISGAGHHVHLEQPEAFRHALADFVERIEL